MVALALLLLALAPPMVQPDPVVARIQAMIARPPALCGAFEQQKQLVGLRRPVRASGRFCVVTAGGVLWSTQQPFVSTLRLTRAEIVESHGDRVTSRLTASDEPTVAVIGTMLFSVLSGDFDALRSAFTIDASTDAGTWRARLTPKDAGVRRAVGIIELSGGEFVRAISITEASGDRTAITFTAFAAGLTALQPDEARALNVPAGSPKPPQ